MTILGLRFAHFANGVSELHGDVARRMWQHVWPEQVRDELPVRHVTNGVHATTWLAPEILALLQQYIGIDWEKRIGDPKMRDLIDEIPDEEIWRAHELGRSRLIRSARESMEKQLTQRNASRAELVLRPQRARPGNPNHRIRPPCRQLQTRHPAPARS